MISDRTSAPRPARLAWNISSETDPNALDAYRAGLSDLYAVSDIDGGRRAFFNRNVAYQFANTVFGAGSSVGQTMQRSTAEIRRSGFDGISMILDRGGMLGDIDGLRISSAPGTIHFRHLARPAATKVSRVDVVVTVLPREIAPEWLLNPRMHGHSISSETAVGRMLAAHLSSTAEVAPELDHSDGLAAINAALVLAQCSIGGAEIMPLDQARAAYRTVRQMAIDIIERNLLSPDLTPDMIAVGLGVSRSTLYRAFEAAGGVVTSIQRRRLARAHTLLRRRQGRTPSVAQIAHECGFASESHFSRAFRERYDMAPGELGATPARTTEPSVTSHKEHVRHDLMMDWLRNQ